MSKARDIADLDFNSPDIDGGNIDGATIGGTTPAAGTFSQVNVDNITIDGQEIDVSSGDLTLDVAGDIILDTGGDDIKFKVGGIDFGSIAYSNSNLLLTSAVSNGDILLKGNDGGSTITALTLDMSNGGRADFNNDIGLNDGRVLRLGNGDDTSIYNDGSHFNIVNTTSNQDMLFKGNDDGVNITALTLDMSNAGAATFNSTIAATGSANSTSSSHTPAVLGSGSYGGGIATRDGTESGWYQQTSGADWHFYHNRTVASQTPQEKRVLSFTSTGDAKVYGHLFGDDDNSYFRINAGPGGGGAIYLNGTNRTSFNSHIQYMADVHNFGDADGNPINTLQVVSDANLVTVNGALNVTGLTTSNQLNTSKILMKDGSTTTGGVFHEKDITGSGTSTDTSLFAETGRDIHFMSRGSANIKATVDNFGIAGGKLYGVNQETNAFTGANANSYSTSTNLGYTQNNSFHASTGEKLVGTCNIRAYTQYVHLKTNLTANSQMFYFRVKGYFYGYGMNEAVIGGYTHSNNSIINVNTQTVYRANNNFNLHVYRAPDGGLVLRVQVGHTTYTEGLALISFSNHSSSTTSSVVILDAIHRDDGNNAY